jgi:outer membrane protein TolC
LTLEEAVSLATQNNANVKIAGQRVQEMDARVRGARADYFPVLSNDSSAVRIAEQQHLSIPQGSLGVYPVTGPIPGTDVRIPAGKLNFGLSTTTLTQPITQFFKIRAGVDVARADASTARADVQRARNEIALKVKEVFYGILSTERRRDAVDAQIRAVELQMAEERHAAESGVILEVKVAEARAQIAQAKHAWGQLQDAVTNMKLEMTDLLGLPLDTSLELVQPVSSASDSAPGVSDALQEALARNPEIEAAGRQLEKARAALRAARAEYIPEISAFAQHVYQDGAPFLSRNNGVVGFHMTWTIFEFGKRRGLVSERAAQVAQAEENLARLRNRVQIDVENAIRKLNRTNTGVDSAKQVVVARQETRRITADQVEAETTNRSTLLAAEAALLVAQADLLRAQYDRSVAAADLSRLTGMY